MGFKLEPPGKVAVGVTTAEAGLVCAALTPTNWSKQADDVACGQQESIRDCSRLVQNWQTPSTIPCWSWVEYLGGKSANRGN